jgi:hypothetical protein
VTKPLADKKSKCSVDKATTNVTITDAKKKAIRSAPTTSTVSEIPSKLHPTVAPPRHIPFSVFEPVIREFEFWSMKIPDALVASAFFTLITRNKYLEISTGTLLIFVGVVFECLNKQVYIKH